MHFLMTRLRSHEKSICITLGCYLVADLQRQSEKEELNTFEKQVSSAQPKWPQLPGSLSLTVVNAEENIPLSPPFHVSCSPTTEIDEYTHFTRLHLTTWLIFPACLHLGTTP